MFTEEIGKLFSHVKIRLFIVLSMVAQMLLIIWTYKRERSSSQPIRRTLWLVAYLVADFAATASLGSIFNFEIQPEGCIENPKNKFLLAFWAPFILQHLGRHGKVTAFSLEDNEFWPRHVITFILNELTAIFISIKAFSDSRLQYPLAFLIITGTLKFGERVFALKHGSMDEQRISTLKNPNPGVDVHDLADRFDICHRSGHHGGGYRPDLEAPFDRMTSNMQNSRTFSDNDSVRSLCEAYQNFNTYRGIFTDSSPTCHELIGNHRYRFLEEMTNQQCLASIRMDVKLAYELFYTKSVISHTIWGWIIQVFSLISIISACALYSSVEKDGFSQPDVVITYALVITTLILETLCFVEAVTSRRSLVGVAVLEGRFCRMLETSILKLRSCAEYITRRITVPRRSRQIGQYSLLGSCFHARKSWKWLIAVFKYFHLTEIWQNYFYSDFVPVEELLINGVLDVLKGRLRELHEEEPNAPKVELGLTDWVSLPNAPNTQILRRSTEKGFKECVLIWHVATDICWTTINQNSQDLKNAYILSNYMLYLMVVQPAAMSSIAVVELSDYHDACEEGIRFFAHRSIDNNNKGKAYRTLKQKYNLIFWNGVRDPNSLLQDGYELAAELERFWETSPLEFGPTLFNVWVKFLSFAAISCSGKQHAQLLGTGWQLFTSVWLFMAHCGLSSVNRIANSYATPPNQAETVTFEIPRSEPGEVRVTENDEAEVTEYRQEIVTIHGSAGLLTDRSGFDGEIPKIQA